MENLRLACMLACAVIDTLAVIAGFNVAQELRRHNWVAPFGISLSVWMAIAYPYFAAINEAYSPSVLVRVVTSIIASWRALFTCMIGLITVAYILHDSQSLSRLAMIYAAIAVGIFLTLGRIILALAIKVMTNGRLSRVVIVTDKGVNGYPGGCDVLDVRAHGLGPDLADPDQMARISALVSAGDRVIVDCAEGSRAAWITSLKAAGVACEIVVQADPHHAAVGIGHLGPLDTLIMSRGPLSLGSRIKKRAFDLALTIPIVVLTAPLMLVVAILVRLESPGPVLFSQERIGQGNRKFRIYKFRSMRQECADPLGLRSTDRNDMRTTRIGSFLRRTSIDELPQLFNVLIGNMSLVGPRPHALGSRAGEQLFWEVSDRYWMRHALKPGLTGLAQIRGYRGATETPADLQGRLRCDLEYLQSWSLRNDLAILFATFRVVMHDNAY